MAALGIRIASNRRGLASIACDKSCFISMKKHFLLIFIFTALLMGFSVVNSFAGILPTNIAGNLTVNTKLTPISFKSNKTKEPRAFYFFGIKKTGSLPPGLTLNQLGVLSGVPKVEGNFTFTVEYYKSNKREVHDFSLPITIRVVKASPPTITTTSPLPPGQMDVPYVQGAGGVNFKATGGIPFLPTPDKPTGYNWSLSAGKIPPGMTFNTVGALSGIPRPNPKLSGNFTQPQTFTFNITATDAVLGNHTKTYSLTINPPVSPTIVTDCPLPEGLERFSYPLVFLKATSGKKEYKWSVGPSTSPLPTGAINRFPDGLTLSLAGAISGKPTLRGLFVFRLKVTDSNGMSVEKECRITIRPAPEFITDKLFICARVGDDAGCFEVKARGGDQPYTWSQTGLPPGLTINSTTGKICGNFTQAGNFTANITVSEASVMKGNATKSFEIVVKPQLEITTISPLAFGIVGRSYPYTSSLSPVKIEAIGGWPIYKWTVILGKLPDGLVLDPSSGIISGTPTKKGPYKFTIRVQDSCDNPFKVIDKEFVINIYDPIALPKPTLDCLTVNKTFSTILTASGGLAPLSWQLVSSSPPDYTITSAGPNSATLAGMPSQIGAVSLVVRVTDANNPPYSEDFTLNYSALSEVKITSACPPSEWTSGKSISALPLTATGGNGNYTRSKHDAVNNPWPTGLDIRDNKIQGTPVLSSNTTNYTIAYTVTDSCGNTDNKTCQMTVYPALTCNQSLNLPCLYNGKVLPETIVFSSSGGKAPYTWTLLPLGNSTKTLPAGLTQKNPTLGNGSVLSGNITENGTFSFIAKVTDSLGTNCSQSHSITVHPTLSMSVPSPIASGKVNQAYAVTLSGIGGDGQYRWRLDPSSIPSVGFTNMQINTSTGVVSGTPTQKGFYKVTVILEDGCGQLISKEVEIPVEDLVYAITPNTEINIWFDASGSMGEVLPVLEKMQSDVLKPCLVQFFNGNGTLFDQRVKVREYADERAFFVLNTQGSAASITQVINLAFSDEAQINYHSDRNAFDGSRTTVYDTDIAALRGTLLTKPSYIRGAVLRVTGFDGFLSFLDAAKGGSGAYAGIYNLANQNDIKVVRNVARPSGGVGTATPLPGSPMYYGNQIIDALNSMGFTLKLCDKAQDPPVSLTPQIVSQNPLEGPMVGVPYQGIISAVGGVLPYIWGLPTGTLPTGLTFNATTGVISGTPTTFQTTNFAIKVTDTNNASDQKSFSLAVTWPPLAVDWSEDSPTLTTGQPADPETFTASGGDGNYTWTISSGSLPSGITLSGNSGKTVSLSGTPTTPGTYNFRVRVSSGGSFNDIDVSYIVETDDSPNPSQMITVVGGTLSPSSELAGEVVAAFQIGKYEVTWGEWQEVRTWAASNGYSDLAGVGDTCPSGSADNFPVINVNWYDVVKWSNARSEKEGLTPVYQVSGTTYKTGQSVPTLNASANGYRLPSEKEWEWAARGGVSSQGYTYSGSNTISGVAWTGENSSGGTKAVGTKAANELGIYDMSGNVWEWCEDVAYTDARRFRGGSWFYGAGYAAVTSRDDSSGSPDDRRPSIGFRLARSSGN